LLTTTNTNTNDNKNLGDEERSSSMKFVWIGLAVVALGGIAYLTLRKK
jgi:LPXTG-motif cell wall-anchored protein